MPHSQKLLLIGGVTWKDTVHPHIGGTTVLMDNLVNYCEDKGVPHVVIPTNKYRGHLAGIRNLMVMVEGIVKNGKQGDIAMVNVSSKAGIVTLLPLVVILSQILGLQPVCRKFAGSIHHYLDEKVWRKQIALHYLKKTKVSFFETESLLSWFHNNGFDGIWFPNVRNSNPYKVGKKYEKRLIFVSQVFEDKGVDILLRLSNRLPKDYTIDIYGPITDSRYNDEYFSHYHARYCGVLKPEEVVSTLAQYNVMVFPTWWQSEGYPGVIVEALSVGMPVISTRIGGIPEMISDGKAGLMVDVKDEDAFEKAILSIDQGRYDLLRKEAEKRFEVYNADLVNPRIINEMMK